MAHTANPSIGGADSLFGPSDGPGDDIFGAAIEQGEPEPAQAAAPVAPVAEHEPASVSAAHAHGEPTVQNVDVLFGSPPNPADSLFDSFGAPDEPSPFDAILDTQNGSLSTQEDSQDGQDVSYDAQNGYYDDEGNWYEFLPDEPTATAATTTYDQVNATGAANGYGTAATSYAPTQDPAVSKYYSQNAYTPAQTTQSQYTPSQSRTSSYAPAASTANAYAPAASAYVPAATTNSYTPVTSNAYAPTTNAYAPQTKATANVYAPMAPAVPPTNPYAPTSAYAPATSSVYPTPTSNAYAPAAASYIPPVPQAAPYAGFVTSPPPPGASLSRDDTIKPRKTVNDFRSETRNAFDPPMPVIAPSRPKYASNASVPASSPYGSYGLAAGQQLAPAPPIATAPPRSTSAAPPPPRPQSTLSPPPPRPASSYSGLPATMSPPQNGSAYYGAHAPAPPQIQPHGHGYGAPQVAPQQTQQSTVGLGFNNQGHPPQPAHGGYGAQPVTQHNQYTSSPPTAQTNHYKSSWGEEDDPEGGSYGQRPAMTAGHPQTIEEFDPEGGAAFDDDAPPAPTGTSSYGPPPTSYAPPPAATYTARPPANVALPPSRTASRASVMSPPPRSGSVASNASNASRSMVSPPPPAATSAYAHPLQGASAVPPPRPASVASRPPSVAPRPPSVAPRPPSVAPSVASRIASPPLRAPSVVQGKYAPPSRTGTPQSLAAASPQDPYSPSIKTAIPARRESSSTTSGSPPQQPFAGYRPRGESDTSVGSAGSSGFRMPPISAATEYAPPVAPYAPVNGTAAEHPARDAYAPAAVDPYAPSAAARPPTQAGPYAPSSGSVPSSGLYAPPAPNGTATRSYGTATTGPYAPTNGSADPYSASSRLVRREASEVSDYGAPAISRMDYNPPRMQSLDTTPAPAAYGTYAPSPSLSGTNDPLGRTGVRIPLVRFGFGGRVITCFHTLPGLSDGFDVSFSARPTTEVRVRRLHEVVPETVFDTSEAKFPGPLLSDPGSPTSLVSMPPIKGNTKAQAKKAAVVKYLDARIEEQEKGLNYAGDSTVEGAKALSKVILVRMLKVLVENDGQISGSETVEAAVRVALLGDRAASTSSDGLRSAESIMSAYATSASSAAASETPLAVYELRNSSLDKIQEFLLRGERRKAYHYALDEKMWAHALVLARSLDGEAWKEAIQEFARAELMSGAAQGPASNGRESLRVLYGLIAGHGGGAVNELVPPKALGQGRFPDHSNSLAASAVTPIGVTPMTSNAFSQPTLPTNVSPEILAKWPDVAATIVSNRMPGDVNGLTALGDTLAAHRWTEAAHVCYLLSRSTTTISGCSDRTQTRVVLVGSPNPAKTPTFSKDPDPFIFSEILEYALSLAPSSGPEQFHGFPHLQAYRLLRAWQLVEMGHDKLAQRYCDAIASTVRTAGRDRASPYFTLTFLEQLKELSDRLVAAPLLEKGGGWLGKMAAKPSLDSLGTWLGGRLTDFIAGEPVADETSPNTASGEAAKPPAGPFSHYSAMSSANTSASSSPPSNPAPIASSLAPPPQMDLRRVGSALAHRAPGIQIERAASAAGYLRPDIQRDAAVQKIASASAATSTFAQANAFSHQYGGGPYGPPSAKAMSPTSATDNGEAPAQELNMPWWGSYGAEDSGATPTAASFVRTDEPAGADLNGFVSLMDTPSPMASSAPSASVSRQESSYEDDDDDDLGFGNKKPSKAKESEDEKPNGQAADKAKPPASPADTKPPDSPKPGGGWFKLPRLWGSSEGGPIKAKLGEEISLVYDKELKRWINPKAPRPAPGPAAPPPPPRSQTASPSTGGPPPPGSQPGTPPNGPPLAGPPRSRPASVAAAADLTVKPPRVRSNLVPTDDESSSAPGTPPPGTPPARGGAKRNVRSRYVDVFQQQ